MRDFVLFFLNGQKQQVSGADSLLSLSDYLRRRLRLTGTKIVCEEGDCGSCTVLVADLAAESPRYKAIDSCICFLFQLDGSHVVTVEGVGEPRELSSVQQAMVDCHGSQCGFCTPGFVMAMTGVMEGKSKCNAQCSASCKEEWRQELTGNLCRCTGYDPILSACEQVQSAEYQSLGVRYPLDALSKIYAPMANDEICLVDYIDGATVPRVFSPTSLERLCDLRAQHPAAKIVAGATDVGVQVNKRVFTPELLLDISRVKDLQQVTLEHELLTIGSGVSWTDTLSIFDQYLPELADIVKVFGSPQIRNMGTLGGNIANASPIADSLPALYVLEAELELVSQRGSRRVNINNFYQGYKTFDLAQDEIIRSICIPLPAPEEMLSLTKVSRRRDMDISTFTAAVRMKVDNGIVSSAAIAMGAVGPTVLRLRKVEQVLVGEPVSVEIMRQAGETAVQEISPISDVRGSADYRKQLARNVFMKFYYQSVAGSQLVRA